VTPVVAAAQTSKDAAMGQLDALFGSSDDENDKPTTTATTDIADTTRISSGNNDAT
jgi:hypothetical protein